MIKDSLTQTQSLKTCVHHWVIDPPAGEMSRGNCKKCGAEQLFINGPTELGHLGPEEKRRIGQFMAVVLRQNPYHLPMHEGGLLDVSTLLKLLRKHFSWIRIAHIKRIVEDEDKKSFEIIGRKIRATYGHTFDVNTVSRVLREAVELNHGRNRRGFYN